MYLIFWMPSAAAYFPISLRVGCQSISSGGFTRISLGNLVVYLEGIRFSEWRPSSCASSAHELTRIPSPAAWPESQSGADLIPAPVNIDGEKTASKRSRKKKTLAELKDEESSLLKERRELKREMANLRMNLERQRTTNEKLKRMKIELQPSPESSPAGAAEESVSGQVQQESTARHPTTTSLMPPVVLSNGASLQSSMSNACNDKNEDAASDSKFILPDLNIPFDDDVTCGIS